MFLEDYYYFYAASRLAWRGENMYEGALIAREFASLSWPSTEFIGEFRHPPIVLWLFLPFGLLPFELSKLSWFLTSLACVAVCMRLTISSVPSTKLPRELATIAIITFFPAIKLLLFGQMTAVVFLALLLALRWYEERRFALSGAALAITLIKPQLLFVVYVAWGVHALRMAGPRFFIGGACCMLLQCVIPWVVLPQSFTWFVQSIPLFLARAGESSMSNLPQLVTSVMPIPGLQAVMILLGIGVGIWAGVTGRVTRPFVLGVLVPLSLALSPHVWSHDLILLFPAFFAAAVAGFERARDLTSALLMTQFLISAALFWSHVSNEVYLALLPVVMLALAPLTLARLARGTEASTL